MRIFLIILLLLSSDAFGHGGEDHGPAATAQTAFPGRGSQLTLVSYQGALEIFVKYPVPELDKPVVGRLFFADYASNHPVSPTAIELSFPGALGAKVTKQPAMISDGVFEFTAVFVRDTGHTALLRYTYGDAEQLASLSPFYAGASAQRQAEASHGKVEIEQDEFPTWTLIPIAIGLGVLGYVLFRRRRKRLLVSSRTRSGTTTSTSVTETKSVS
jgi:hypothetical protein